jgi:uroporphyrinogen-III synthase
LHCVLRVPGARTEAVPAMLPWVVVTRPEPEAGRWVADLQQAGWPAVALPLMAFAPPADLQTLIRSRQQLHSYQASMWVSPQAVQAFAADGCLRENQALSHMRFWAPGPGTARALQTAGVPLDQIDQPDRHAPQFDSDALWTEVSKQVAPGFKLLLVHGETPPGIGDPSGESLTVMPARERLAQRVRQSGGEVDGCTAYRRGCPEWSESQQTMARQLSQAGAIWLLSSSEAIGHLSVLTPGCDWTHAVALATHPRIAQTARELGFGCVQTCRPALADVRAALRDMAPPA